ncbi:MAG: ATP-binding protein [Candidatus Heimdallarchaeota archaeon]
MLNDSDFDLIIAIYLTITAIIFGISTRRSKILKRWGIGIDIFTIGAVFIYFQILNPIYRIVGDLFYTTGLFILLMIVFAEYFLIFRRSEYQDIKQSKNYLIFLNGFIFTVVFLQFLLVIMAGIGIILLLRIYLSQRTVSRLFMALTLSIGFISGFSTILESANVEIANELNFSMNFAYITFLLATGLAAHIEQRIIESEEKFRTIAEQSIMGIGIIQDYIIKYANKGMEDLFGYSIEEMMNWPPRGFVITVHPDDQDLILEQLQIKQKGLTNYLVNYQFRGKHKSGKTIWIDNFTKSILFKGKPASLFGFVNITEKKNAEKLILDENLKLQELNKIRHNLLNRISHELKTPLTTIFGVSQILQDSKGELEKKFHDYIDIAHRGTLRLKKLISDLIQASDLDDQRIHLEKTNENLKTIVIDCVYELSLIQDDPNIKINMNLPEDIYFPVDKNRISQAIINVVSNAIKNSPSLKEIDIDLKESPNNIDIIIKDKGVGITSEEQSLLFQKFGKIERYGQNLDIDTEGVGMGLYITKEIVELHGGNIIIESEGRNKGTTVTIRLLK